MADKGRTLPGAVDTTGGTSSAPQVRASVSPDPVRSVDPAATGRGDDPQPSDVERVSEPPSPCVSVCALDENDVCMGCYRTAGEITDWFMATAAEKHAILRAAEERRAADSPIRLL